MKKKINQILCQSHNFLRLYSSINSILFQYNNNDYKLLGMNLFSSINNNFIKRNNKESENEKELENICSKLLFYLYNINEGNNNNIITDMSYMFYGCSSLKSISGLSKLNTINAKDMSHIFENCSKLVNLSDITH